MKKYLYQQFLPNCNTEHIILLDFYTESYEDAQCIPISVLDEKVDFLEDLKSLIKNYDYETPIILINDRSDFSNPIMREYSDKTIKSYIYWLSELGFKCMWAYR